MKIPTECMAQQLTTAIGIRRVVEHVTNVQIARSQPIPKEHIESIRMGTTVATNGMFWLSGIKFL